MQIRLKMNKISLFLEFDSWLRMDWIRTGKTTPIRLASLAWILLNQTKIRLYLPFFDEFGFKFIPVWIQINRKIIKTIWFRVNLIKFWKDFYVCIVVHETVASFGNHGCPIQAPLIPLGPSHHSIVLRGLSGAHNWSPIMPKMQSLGQRMYFFLVWRKSVTKISNYNIYIYLMIKYY